MRLRGAFSIAEVLSLPAVFRRVQHSAGIYIKNNFAEFSTLSIQREKRPKNKGALLIGDGISDGDTLVSNSGELVHIAAFEFE